MSEKSNIKYNSNIQPVGKVVAEDKDFLSKVRDYFALKKLDSQVGRRYSFSKIQKDELRYGMKCAYSPKDEYCWGIKKDGNGHERISCTCLKTDCRLFSECRRDFMEEELFVLTENRAEAKRINNALSSVVVRVPLDNPAGTGEKKTEKNSDGEREVPKDPTSGTIPENGAETEDISPSVPKSGDADDNTGTPAGSSGTEKDEVHKEPITTGEHENATGSEEAGPSPELIRGFGSFENTEQETIIRMDPRERTVVNAGPGTGKTYTLIEKIIYLINNLDIEPERILILCFSRAAVDVIKERMEQAAEDGRVGHIWRRIDIRTFDSYITYLIALLADVNPELLPPGYRLENQNYEERIRTGISLISENPGLLDYDHVIVDEVQDLVGSRAELVLTILEAVSNELMNCGFTILGDACQALYDYLSQDNSGQMSSADFYDRIFSNYRDANYLALEKNYRQGDEYEKFTRPYRAAILKGDALSRTEAAKALAAGINNSEASMKDMTEDEARRLIASGTLGILTRNNGQALQISTWLRNNDVPHRLQYSLTRKLYGAWIAAVFMEYGHEQINETEFEKVFSRVYPDVDAFPYWEALVSTQRDQGQPWFDVEDLLKGILYSPKDPLLFSNIETGDTSITVSNIHRAKGREFDNVLVLEDVLEQMQDPENDDINEHKVCYVAVTRPRKKIEKFRLSKSSSFFYSLADDEGRCFKQVKNKWKKKGFLSHLEVGKSRDILETSFAASTERQEYIRNNVKPDMGIILKKMPEGEVMRGSMTYSIHLDDRPAVTLGYMGQGFRWGIVKAWQRIFNNKGAIAYSYLPDTFNDVYVERLTSCISIDNGDCPGAKSFGSMCVWTGISLTGLAHRSNNTLD